MVKKSFLTPVLSGVLAITVAGSGALYYFDKKDEVKKDDAKNNSVNKSITQVKDEINETLDFASKAMKGELDFAYSANAEVILGSELTKEMGFDIKPIGLQTVTKQKANKTSADLNLTYDSKSLVSLNTVYDNEAGVAYIQIPELSDAYLSASESDLDALMGTNASTYGVMSMSAATTTGRTFDEMMGAFEDIDYDALLDSLVSYVDVIAEEIPDGKDNGNVSGDIDGNTYDYSVKTYEITGQVVYDMCTAVVDKAKNDTALIDFFAKLEVSQSDYIAMLDEFASEMDMSDADLADSIAIDVYYSGEDVVGFAFDIEGDKMKLVTISSDDVMAVDMDMDIEDMVYTIKGSAKADGDVMNGKFDYNLSMGGEAMSMALVFDNIGTAGDMFTGTMRLDMTIDSYGETTTPSVVLTSNSTESKLDLSFSLAEGGNDYFTLNLTGEETDASDITIPTGTIYSLNETDLEAYLATCNTEGFLANLESALGTDLYNELFASSYDYDDYDTYDYDFEDYDYEDYDFEDYDLEDYDLEDYDFDNSANDVITTQRAI